MNMRIVILTVLSNALVKLMSVYWKNIFLYLWPAYYKIFILTLLPVIVTCRATWPSPIGCWRTFDLPLRFANKEQLDNKSQQSGNKFSSQIISQHSLITGILGLANAHKMPQEKLLLPPLFRVNMKIRWKY